MAKHKKKKPLFDRVEKWLERRKALISFVLPIISLIISILGLIKG